MDKELLAPAPVPTTHVSVKCESLAGGDLGCERQLSDEPTPTKI